MMRALLTISVFFIGLGNSMATGQKDCEEQSYLDQEVISDLLSCIERDVPLSYHPRIYGFIDYFSVRNREYTQMVIDRSTTYFPIFEEKFREKGIPEELKYLAIVESGLNPKAMSRVGAGGLWQFMPSTGRMFGLQVDNLVDDRLDPFQSTDAAAKYLSSLYKQFGDWELALAAYNCGPGKVRRAIRRSGYKKSFWEIYPYLPRETRNYVPQYVAFVFIMNHRDELGFSDESYQYMPEFYSITVSQNLDLNIFSDQLEACIEDLERLNPQIKRGLIPIQRKEFVVRIPSQCYERFELEKDAILLASSELDEKEKYLIATYDRTSTYGKEKHVYRVKSGDVLGTIAESYQVRVSDIRKWNNLRNNIIRVNQPLAIWKAPGFVARKYTPPPPSSPQAIPGSKTHLVRYGDTLWDISRMYEGLSIEKIKALNKLENNKIKPGQVLRIG